jgi:hypothetical protein
MRQSQQDVERLDKLLLVGATSTFHKERDMSELETLLVELSETISAARRRVAEFEAEMHILTVALEESVKLQSHYAILLNHYDGGWRLQFDCAKEWLDRLTLLGIINALPPARTSPPALPAPS